MLSAISNLRSQIPNALPGAQHPEPCTPDLPGARHPTPGAALPRFVVTLDAPAEAAELIRVPLAITGRWVRDKAEFASTREDLEGTQRPSI